MAANGFTIVGFCIHVLTASGAACALLALMAAVEAKWAAMFAWLGIALVLDEHVNRPGHVPGTLETAIGNLAGNPDPTNWTDAQEGELIDLYIDARNDTNMTNPPAACGEHYPVCA